MIREIILKPEAEQDLADAYEWYEGCRNGLGVEFLDAVQLVLETASHYPERFPVSYADLRIALVKRFPYLMVFSDEPRQITVYAVYHSSRDPRGWQSRAT